MNNRHLFLIVLLLVLAPLTGYTKPALLSTEALIRKIEENQRGWLTLSGTCELRFKSPQGREGICQGDIIYHAVEERMMVRCYETIKKSRKELAFVFKSHDEHFEFYSPKENTLYYGNIFDLESSPHLESHIKPLHLYHALKFGYLPDDQTTIKSWNKDTVTFQIKSQWNGITYTAREITATHSGHTLQETYYHYRGYPLYSIQRADFRKMTSPHVERTSFPHKIRIQDYKQESSATSAATTEITFKKAVLSADSDSLNWRVSLPRDAKMANLTAAAWQPIHKGDSYQI